MTAARRPRRALAAAALMGAVLVLGACANQQPGAAATLGDSRISEQALAAEVQAILAAQGQPVDTPDAALTSLALGRMIVIDLVDTLSEREGVVVSQGRIDEQVATYVAQSGDRAAMEATFVEQGVAPSQIESVVRLNLLAQDLGIALVPDGTPEDQGNAVFAAVGALSDELEVTVSPRFGTWDTTTLQVGPVPDDLATPPLLQQ